MLGIGMAMFAFIAVFVIGAVLARQGTAQRQVEAVVAVRDIQARQVITPDLVALAPVPAGALQPGAIVRLADVKGSAALVRIPKGAVLSQNIVAVSPDQIDEGSVAYLPIPPGFVALTIPTNELQGVAGYVAPGDYINVLATINTQAFDQKPPRPVTRTVFTSVRVIRVGPPSEAKAGQQQGVASSLTVLLSECDAQYIDWLITNASLKYALLSYKDYSPAPATADQSCPSTVAPGVIGPAQVDARWGFTRA
jgi:pilus assembly protein CpaB